MGVPWSGLHPGGLTHSESMEITNDPRFFQAPPVARFAGIVLPAAAIQSAGREGADAAHQLLNPSNSATLVLCHKMWLDM